MSDLKMKHIRRLGAASMSMIMGCALIPKLSPANVVKAEYVKNHNTTRFGTSQMANPAAPSSSSDTWNGSFVYFGKYDGEPIRFRVLDMHSTRFNNHTLFLDSDEVLYYDFFDIDDEPNSGATRQNDWTYSDVSNGLNGYSFLDKNNGFTKLEKAAITRSRIASHDLVEGVGSGQVSGWAYGAFGSYVPLTGEKVFLLDAEDASNIAYGYVASDNSYACRKKNSDDGYAVTWWLRSATPYSPEGIGKVSGYGDLGYSFYPNTDFGIAPAMNVSLNSIMFTSAVSGNYGETGTEYKLTLKDSNLNIEVQYNKTITIDRSTITIPYEITGYDFDEEAAVVTVLILDKEYTDGNTNGAAILWYEPLFSLSSYSRTGSGIFVFPDTFDVTKWGEDYFVYILAENQYGDHETDYASAPARIDSPLKEIELDFTGGPLDYGNMNYYNTMQYLFEANLVDIVPSEEDAFEVDIDKNGTADMLIDFSHSTMSRMNSCSIFGTYTFTYKQVRDYGYKSISFKFPLCKTSFTKAEPNDTGILLKWKAVSGFSNYNIYRSTSANGTYSYLASVTGGTTKYTDTTAGSGKTYYYKVRPYFKANGKTIYAGWSDAKKVTVLADTKLTAEPKSGVTMKLSWTAVSGAQSYEIYRATSASGPYTYVKATTGTSTSDTGLTAGTRYYYMIRAKRTVNGEVQYSKYASAVSVALATPTMESATFTSGKGVTLTWTKASGADRYNVYKYNTSTGKYDYVASVLGGTLTYTDASGKKGDYYKVRAYKRVDGVVYYGGWSNAKAGK
ncbi:MAG: hypothetical protein J5379_02090 [Clostridiales bacterium]|nr:hypothetical protein [Clostridiales bacterium]